MRVPPPLVHPGTVRMRGSMVIQLRPYLVHDMSTPAPPLPPPPSLPRTCVLRRLESSALLAALISSLGALIKRNLVVEMRSELKGLLMPMDMLLRTIFTMRVSSRSLFRSDTRTADRRRRDALYGIGYE